MFLTFPMYAHYSIHVAQSKPKPKRTRADICRGAAIALNKSLTPEQRKASALKAIRARWNRATEEDRKMQGARLKRARAMKRKEKAKVAA